MDVMKNAIDELRECVDRCTDHETVLLSNPPQHRVYGVREDFDRLIAKLERAHVDDMAELTDARVEVARLRAERDEWRAKAEQAMESYQDAKDSRDELRSALEESEHEQSLYGDRISTLLRKLDAANERIDMLESTLDDTARERDELREGNEILARSEVVELPKDADGEYIHVGDMIKTQGLEAKKVEAISDGHVWVNLYESPMYQLISLPSGDCRRVHSPTVTDVLREFWHASGKCTYDNDELKLIVTEYAEKLRMADGGE